MPAKLKTIIVSDLLFLALTLWFLFALPPILFPAPTSHVVEASSGELLSASIAKDGQWRFPVTDRIPEKFIKCIVTFEDKRFYSHPGIDLLALGRATQQNWKAKSVVSGGSTLSMQVIRLSRSESRTIWQKLIEMLLVIRLELSYSKADIIRLYASNAPFGGNVVGLEAASWRYFGRSPETLSWGEMATLAVLPNSPSLVHPGKNSFRLIQKRNDLLDKMARLEVIDAASANLAKFESIPGKPQPLPQHAPHLLNRFKTENVGQTRITSTIDFELQLKVNALLKRYNNRYRANDINNIATLILNVKQGTVAVYAGNIYQPENKELESHVDMIRAPRSPGSTLKPLLYASMLSDGLILPRTLIPDIPMQIGGYSPQNYDLGYDGAIPADQALSRSLNIPAVKMLQTYKYQRFYDQLKKIGFSTLNKSADHYGLSLILGGSEVTMWDLAKTYMGMARTLSHFNDYRGKYNPHDYDAPSYNKLEKRDLRYDANETQINSTLDHGSIWASFNAMEELMRPGEEGLWQQFSSSQRLAWKTGTSFGFRDAWAVGLNPGYVVVVWVGNADGEGRPGLTGIDVAAPVLFDIFKSLPHVKWFQPPKNKLKKMRVCRQSGYKAGDHCRNALIEFVSPSGEKTVICPFHKLIHLDRKGRYRVTDACESPAAMQHQPWFILPPAMEYYYKIKNSDYKLLPPFNPGCKEDGDLVMEMIYPKNNANVYIPVELNGNLGKLVLNATHRSADAKVYWHIDGEYVATTQNYHQLAVSPPPGRHTLTLVDHNGERLVQTFVILDKEMN